MNGPLIMMGVIAAMSIVLFSVVAYRLSSRTNDVTLLDTISSTKNSSLEEDIKDILEFIPLIKIRLIINNYLKYDSQLGDTVSFIEDQKKFIAQELQRLPQLSHLLNFLKENGLEVDNWKMKIQDLWKTKATFVKEDPNIATGGFTMMIQNILNTVPKNELHKILRQKVKYSGSFHRFLQILKSKDFVDFCDAIDENIVLQRHIFWAKQEGIEITFALELLRNLYIYITEEIW